MKIELKHLAGYFPYGLKAQDIRTKELRTITLLHFTYDMNTVGHNHLLYEGLLLSKHLSILRPLSDLTKDENFDLYMDLCEEIGVIRCEHLILALQDNLKYAFNLQDLNALEEFMNKNHFDWKYNLIEKGLAIDINTL